MTDLDADAPRAPWTATLAPQLRKAFPDVEIVFDQARTTARGYYREACFKIHAATGEEFGELADGGLVDWTQRLLSDAKERLCISGIGSERVCALRST